MFPWYSHLRSQIRDRLLQEWQVWHKPRDDFSFPPSTKLSAIFTLLRHVATRLFQMKLAASYLLGHPNWHRPSLGLFPRCGGNRDNLTCSTLLPLPPVRQGALFRDLGPQVLLV